MAERWRYFPGPIAGDLKRLDPEDFGRRQGVRGRGGLFHRAEVAIAAHGFNVGPPIEP